MTISVYLPLALSLLLAVAGRWWANRLDPGRAAKALVTAAVLSAATSSWGLVLLVATLLSETPPVTQEATERGLAIAEPVPTVVAMAAGIALLVASGRVLQVVRARQATSRELRALCALCGAGELAVAPVETPQAFAVPGRPPRIFVTRGMLRALDPDERRALLAHERSHLREGHHRQRAAVEIAAALNPLLIPAREAVAFLVERCADEHAAAAVGSRTVAARSLATAALAGAAGGPAGALAYQRLAVSARVAALQVAPLPERRLLSNGMVLFGVATALAAADATFSFLQLIAALLPS